MLYQRQESPTHVRNQSHSFPKRYNEKGEEELKDQKQCELEDRENPDWPVGYTYLDRFLDDMKDQNNGDVVFRDHNRGL